MHRQSDSKIKATSQQSLTTPEQVSWFLGAPCSEEGHSACWPFPARQEQQLTLDKAAPRALFVFLVTAVL